MKENKDKKSSGFQMIAILLQNLNRTLDLWLLALESFYNILSLTTVIISNWCPFPLALVKIMMGYSQKYTSFIPNTCSPPTYLELEFFRYFSTPYVNFPIHSRQCNGVQYNGDSAVPSLNQCQVNFTSSLFCLKHSIEIII